MTNRLEGLDPTKSQHVADIEKEIGHPSNFFRIMALHPASLQAFRAFQLSVMGAGTLDKRFKEMIYIAVCAVNESDYCSYEHEHAGLAVGLAPAEIHAVKTENDTAFDLRERAMLHYARELTRTCAVESDTLDAIQNNFSPEQQVELTEVIALANFTNRFNNGLHVSRDK